MHIVLLAALIAVLTLPSVASAATVTAERRPSEPFGNVTFKARTGERNAVTVTPGNRRLRFHDARNRVTARGDCRQIDSQTASCPITLKDIAKVRLGNRGDSADVDGAVLVLGGSGDDVLSGSRYANLLNGQSGADRLVGWGGRDRLTAGPGSDTVLGGGGDDELVDGETDALAAADVFRGGRSRDTGLGTDRGE